jgi:Na+/H+ antiporter NhaB
MTEQDVRRSLNLVRYGGVVVTVVVFISLIAFSVVMGQSNNAVGLAFNEMVPYIALFTVVAAVLSVVFYFVYRAVLRSRMKTA